MGTLGKVLIGLNLVAAIGFLYLASDDWAKRQGWAAAAFRHELLIQGMPLNPPPKDAQADEDFVPFDVQVSPTVRLTQVRKDTLQSYLPAGGDLGGDLVTNQTQEVERLRTKIKQKVDAADGPAARRVILLTYLLNLAESGTERDGLTALLRDQFDPQRAADARQELPLLGHSPVQQAALEALLRLSALRDDIALQKRELVARARKGLADAARAALPNAVPTKAPADQRAEALRKLVNALTAILEANGETPDPGRIAAAKPALAAAGDPTRTEYLNAVADVAGNPLNDRAAVSEARTRLEKLVTDPAGTEGERSALTAVAALIADPQPKVVELTEQAGRGFLEARFQQASKLASETPGPNVIDPAGKQGAIAHLLYFIDANLPWEQRAAWHQRVQAVVGMVQYVRIADAQATAMANMAQRLQAQIFQEATQFEAEYQDLVQRAVFLAGQFDDAKSRVEDQTKLEADHKQNVANRTEEYGELTKEHQKVRAEVKSSLKDLRAEQEKLYKLNALIREAQDKQFHLERQLRSFEERLTGAGSKGR